MEQKNPALGLAPLDTLKVSVPESILSEELEGETVLLDLNSQNYYGLNRLGSRIWSLLRVGQQPEEICRTLVQEYWLGARDLREDVAAFLYRLAQEGIILVSHDNHPSA